MVPEDLRYTAEHEWVLVTESGAVRIGITDYAQATLGDIVFVTLLSPETEVGAGAACGEIESTKSVAEVFAPIAGKITARNDVVETSPETINSDPYGSGWLLEITPAESDPLASLLDAAGYEALVANS